ncbi:hypothetical protein P153DRAFT_360362 [Dothidotthia symphoricarpi CBS 119687]|uniref:Rhodopsin domain-containing protein n=1 Tax=Dothidotthia symphoricarpi CBS 119687 TaxID=1392245 RepID=A0A6A6A2H6_9PLEO|nr:uncharacterized protein P153DRAFT_360362 [Dothidotthia symphoricarpi CBS 119687]KAF2125374.1 hypothetical protein P153DRAFT_360362 [Dothidotthia symphoricarpi CBS 119687]
MSSTGLTETTLRTTGIGLMIYTTLVVGARAALRVEQKTKIQWDDGWLILAWVFFMTVSGVYVGKTDLMFRMLALQEGRLKPYPGLTQDALAIQVMFFFTSPGLWLTLWSVKFSLLAFYKRMMINVPLYIKLWWAVLVYSILTCKLIPSMTLILSVTLHITSCSSLRAWFTSGGCGATPEDVRGSLISFWEAFAVDLTTDILIMLLPVTLIRNLQMPLSRKLSVGALFALAILCMLASIIRVIQVGATTGASTSTPSTTWLALWSIIESSVAITVGCGPGLYRKAKAVYSSNQGRYYDNSHGYIQTPESRKRSKYGTGGNGSASRDDRKIPLETLVTSNTSHVHGTDSQEELVGQDVQGKITVTKSVRISRVQGEQ